MADLLLRYLPSADDSDGIYSYANNLCEDDDTLTLANVSDSRFVISSLSGAPLKSLTLGGAIQWDDANKLISINIKNGDLKFASRDMEVTYEWWVELSDQRALVIAQGRGLVERGAA